MVQLDGAWRLGEQHQPRKSQEDQRLRSSKGKIKTPSAGGNARTRRSAPCSPPAGALVWWEATTRHMKINDVLQIWCS